MQDRSHLRTEVPTLETERLRLRGHQVEDFVHCAAMWGDAQVTRHIGGKPLTEEEAWAKLLRYVGHWSLLSPRRCLFANLSPHCRRAAKARREISILSGFAE